MKQEKIDYSDVIDLGFKRYDHSDTVFFNRHGYNYFRVELELTKHIYLDWEIETRTVKMVRCNKESDVLAELPIIYLDHVKQIVKFYTATKNDRYNGMEKANRPV